ncbi:unnamed protein product [Camellia sinensis]
MKVTVTHDGFLDAKSNRRLGKRVIHSDLTEKKLMEVKKVLDIDAMDLDVNESHNKSNHIKFQKMGINRDISTCGMLHSIGSDLTHTWGKSETHKNGSIRSKQNGLRASDYGNTPTSRAEDTLWTGIPGNYTNPDAPKPFSRHLVDYQNLFHHVSLQLSKSSKNVGENGCLDRKKHLSSATDLFLENSEDKMVSTKVLKRGCGCRNGGGDTVAVAGCKGRSVTVARPTWE